MSLRITFKSWCKDTIIILKYKENEAVFYFFSLETVSNQSRISLETVSKQFQISLESVSKQFQISLESVSKQFQISLETIRAVRLK